MVAPAFLTHMAIGTPYAWSVLSGTVAQELGVVSAAADDWSLNAATLPMSIAFAMHGLVAAGAGSFQYRVGPRASMAIAGTLFGGGMGVGALGIHLHNLPLLYAGYGIMAGVGIGLAYTPPLQTLMEWFSDRRGLASGMVIAGFGSGALLFSPAASFLTDTFSRAPEFAGPRDAVEVIAKDGRYFVESGAEGLREVVLARSSDLAKLGDTLAALPEGYYFTGTGATGAAPALAVLGAAYFLTMLGSALAIKRPAEMHPSRQSTVVATSEKGVGGGVGGVEAGERKGGGEVVEFSSRTVPLEANEAVKTPQFYLLASVFGLMAAGGLGVLSVAKPLVGEVFSASLPFVDSAFASAFVMALAVGNLGGRLLWSSVSDKIGRRNTFHLLTLSSIPLYLSMPFLVEHAIDAQSSLAVYGFVGASAAAVSIMGAVYACLPAYEADLFGPKFVGAIHGRTLLASSAAALGGPSLFLQLRKQEQAKMVDDLLPQIDPATFQETFHASIAEAKDLVASKAVTLADLAALTPANDPSPYVYHPTLYTLAALATAASLTHYALRPVSTKYFQKIAQKRAKQQAGGEEEEQGGR